MEEDYESGSFNIEIFNNVKVGDILVFRDLDNIHEDDDSGQINFSWDSGMDNLIDNEIIVTKEMLPALSNRSGFIAYIDGYTIGTDMLRPKNYENIQEEKIETMPEDKVNFNIIEPVDESVINEMISKVDFERFKKLMAIGSDDNASARKVKLFLQDWAHAKYDFYLLFGNKLSIETDIEVEMSRNEMRSLVEEKLFKKFPRHYAILARFDMSEFIENRINGGSTELSTYCGDMYKTDKKLSKFISEYCQDTSLNDALANVLGNRKIVSKIAISIDPYDYMTMSLNNHRWESCQKLGEGSWATAPLALMIDSTTMIGYKYSGENVKYNYHNYEFEGNSKSWRQCLYYDKNTSSIIFSRQYPDDIDNVEKILREMIEETVSNYLNVKNTWKISHDRSEQYYEEGTNLLYHDVAEGASHSQVTNRLCKEEPHFVVGEDYNCLKCGDYIEDSQTFFLCSDCINGYTDDDEENNDEEDE